MSSILADHVAALLVHRAKMENGNKWGAFEADIIDDFESRHSLKVPGHVIAAACARLRDVGGCLTLPSPIAGDMYLIDAEAALSYFEPDSRPSEHTSVEYDRHWAAINENFHALRAYYFGRDAWARRAVEALAQRDLFADESVFLAQPNVPASDRIVTVQHNQRGLIEDPINEMVDLVEAENSVDGENGLRELILGRLRAGRELIRAGIFSIQSLQLTLIVGLRLLVERYGDTAIGVAAAKLLDLLLSQFGIG